MSDDAERADPPAKKRIRPDVVGAIAPTDECLCCHEAFPDDGGHTPDMRQYIEKLDAIAPYVTDGGTRQLYRGGYGATSNDLQTACREWERVYCRITRARIYPGEMPAVVTAQSRVACPLAWQSPAFFTLVMASGWLLHEVGRLASCARVFGARRGRAIEDHPVGISLCEGLVRTSCKRIDPDDPWMHSPWAATRLCESAGLYLLLLALRPAYEHTLHWDVMVMASAESLAAIRRARVRGFSINARRENDRITALIEHSTRGNAKAVHNLLRLRADPNLKDATGHTALMHAARHNRIAVASILIATGADLDATSDGQWTATMCASLDGHSSVVKLLARAGADVEATSEGGESAMTVAAHDGFVEVVRVLIDEAASVGAALVVASARGHLAVVQALVGREDEGRRWHAIWLAAAKGYVHVVSALLVGATRHDGGGFMALRVAVREHHPGVVTILVDACVCIDIQDPDTGETVLMLAVTLDHHHHNAIVDTLIAAGAELDARDYDGMTALIRAVRVNNAAMVERLVAAGSDLNTQCDLGRTALHWSMYTDAVIVKCLVDAQCSLNKKANMGETALMLASYIGNTEAAKLLVDAHADLELECNGGKRAMRYAVESECGSTINTLIDAGAELDAKCHSKMTPVMWAAMRGDVDTVRVLVGARASLDCVDRNGRTALVHAALGKKLEVATVLAGTRLCLDHASALGETALTVAADKGNITMLRVLVDSGCRVPCAAAGGEPSVLARARRGGRTDVIEILENIGC